MPRVLVVDDDEAILETLKEILGFEDYEVSTASDGQAGLDKALSECPDVVLLDIKMPKMDGMEVLEQLRAKTPEIPVVMISGHGTVETAVEAVKKGAYDFLEKPPDLNRLLITIRNARERQQLVQQTHELKQQVRRVVQHQMLGQSPALERLKEQIAKVAPTDARVLITGPNGSGKELVARAIHENSSRQQQAFIEVNCAAIPSELIESELFGHEKGAFTSAVKRRIGKFEQAHRGTLFMDEIGDMSLSAQAKVLRVLQENRLNRVGGDKDLSVDVRVIAATNKDLGEAVANNTFREDLYHRLSVILLRVPPLSERRDDIPELAQHFIKAVCEQYQMPQKSFQPEALEVLQELPWSGNIRELRNVVERLAILGSPTITKSEVEELARPFRA